MKFVLENPIFSMAARQFDLAADVLKLSQEIRERAKWPKATLSVLGACG